MDSNTLFGVVLPVVAVVFGCSIPIVVILTKHQREMAELIHKDRGSDERSEALESEVKMLRAEMDEVRRTMRALEAKPPE